MLLRTLTLRNFGSFRGEHGPIQLSGRGLVSIVGQNHDDARASSNGSGKSTLLDAIDWCLFGAHPRGGKAKSVVNEAAGKDCRVQLTLDVAGEPTVTVTRSIKVKGVKDGLHLSFDGDDCTKLDPSKTQEVLERIIGFDRTLFHSAVLFAQNDDLKFAEKTDAERKKLLTKMLPELAVVDRWLENAKALRERCTDAAAQADADVTAIRAQVQALHGADPRMLMTQWETEHTAQVTKAQHDTNAATQRREHAYNVFAAIEVPPAPATPVQTEYDAAFVHWTQELERLNRELVQASADVMMAERDLKAMSGWQSSCPTCHRPFDVKAPDPAHIAVLDEKLQHAMDNASAVQAAVNDATAHRDAAAFQQQRAVQAHAAAQQQHDTARREQDRASLALDAAHQAEAEASQRLHLLTQQHNPYREQVQTWVNQLAQLDDQQQKANEALVAATTATSRAEWWVKALGPKGIKSHLLDLRVQELTAEVNRWVGLLTQNTCYVSMSAFTETGKGSKARTVDRFTITVFKAQPDGSWLERDYCQWSGGEKHRLAVGIDFGFSRMVEKRLEGSCPQLFLDEIFQKSLDTEGKVAMAELLTHLAREKDSIWVVDHDARLQGVFQDVLHVHKKDGASSIVHGNQP